MKTFIKTVFGIAGAAVGTSWGLGTGGLLHKGHVDCIMMYSNGQWIMGYQYDTESNPLDPWAPATGPLLSVENTVLVARDQPFTEGSRVVRPEHPMWEFTGVAASAPLWWFPQTNWAEGNYVGFTMSGPFATYEETDPRLAGSLPQKWGRVNAVSKRYRGKGRGHFSMWTTSTASGLKVWVDSRDGFQPTDRYFVGGNGHGHPAMGFSSLGLYEIGYRGRAWLDVEQTKEVVSPLFGSYVAVGTYAIWMAENFSPSRWFIPEVSGEAADPDGDGVSNLMEYACGMNPRLGDAGLSAWDGTPGLPESRALEGGTVLVATWQRTARTNPQISYRWEVAEDAASGSWAAREEVSREPAREGWERVSYTMPGAGPGNSRCFGRLRVVLLDAVEYP